MSSGSYDVHASHRDFDSEIERLRAQTLASWTKELRHLQWFGLRNGMEVLEIGCGPGFVTEQLIGAFPDSRVTAVEIDRTLAERARVYLNASDTDRVRIQHASANATGLADDTFDFAIARLIFQHLPEPGQAAREIWRVLKPGGKLVIIDSDDGVWGLTQPPLVGIDPILEKYGQAQALQGGNRLVGRELWRILESAGFVRLASDAVVIHSDEVGLEALLPQLEPDRLLPLVAAGLVSTAEIDAVRGAYRALQAAESPMIMLLLLMAAGEKPVE